jgi:hypothetical protein
MLFLLAGYRAAAAAAAATDNFPARRDGTDFSLSLSKQSECNAAAAAASAD